MALYQLNLLDKVGFSCSSLIGPCELSYEVVSKNDSAIELISCYLKNYRWVLYMRDYNHDGKVDYVTIVKDLHPYMISRKQDGGVSYDTAAFTEKEAAHKLAQADWLWRQAIDLLGVRRQLSQFKISLFKKA